MAARLSRLYIDTRPRRTRRKPQARQIAAPAAKHHNRRRPGRKSLFWRVFETVPRQGFGGLERERRRLRRLVAMMVDASRVHWTNR